jgi:hypothetical protein
MARLNRPGGFRPAADEMEFRQIPVVPKSILSQFLRKGAEERTVGTRSLLLAALFLAFTGMAVPAGGAPPSPFVPAATTPDQKYAACLVDKDRMGSSRFVLAEPGTDDEKAAFASLTPALGHCNRHALHGAAEPEHAMLRGLIAERLWLTSVFRIETWRSIDYDPDKMDFEKGFDATPDLRDTYRFAWCVATIQLEAIDALLRTRPSSDAEQAAFQALEPSMSRCFAHGQTLALQRPLLRALLAEQLYRRYPHPVVMNPVFRRPRPAQQGMIGIVGQTNGNPMEKQNSH